MLNHIHCPVKIEYRNKDDSVYVECACGKVEAIGTQYSHPPMGWGNKDWNKFIKIVNDLNEYFNNITTHYSELNGEENA